MTASPEQQKSLFDHCLDFATTMLVDSGEFHPFGAEISADGQLRAVGGWNGEERPNAGELYALLQEAFIARARNGDTIAAALAANVDVPANYESPYPDAVRIQLEAHENSRFIYVPYRINKAGLFRKSRTVEFSEPFAVALAGGWFEA